MSAHPTSSNECSQKSKSIIVDATLPIDTRDGLLLRRGEAQEFGTRLAQQYSSAEPYPHIVIDNFLPEELADLALRNFPATTRAGDVFYLDLPFEHNKRQIQPSDCNETVRRIFDFFNSGPILHFLEALTTIKGLIPDPHFSGGGFHEISRGGRLGLHADFRINRELRLNRRLNLLIYLNKHWQEGYGGHLEMWDRSGKHRINTIAPVFNRCVIFNTEKDSYHGHPDPLTVPDDITRKSMALYYYTASEKLYLETPEHSTVFMARPSDAISLQRAARKWKRQTYFSMPEILPPILYRYLKSLKQKR